MILTNLYKIIQKSSTKKRKKKSGEEKLSILNNIIKGNCGNVVRALSLHVTSLLTRLQVQLSFGILLILLIVITLTVLIVLLLLRHSI